MWRSSVSSDSSPGFIQTLWEYQFRQTYQNYIKTPHHKRNICNSAGCLRGEEWQGAQYPVLSHFYKALRTQPEIFCIWLSAKFGSFVSALYLLHFKSWNFALYICRKIDFVHKLRIKDYVGLENNAKYFRLRMTYEVSWKSLRRHESQSSGQTMIHLSRNLYTAQVSSNTINFS